MKPFQEESLREFNRLCRRYDSVCHELALAAGLSDSAFAILYYILEEGEGCSQGELCGGVCLSKQTVHSSVRKLEGEGILALEGGRVRLTAEGRRLAEERVLPVMELENAAFRDMDPRDRRELMALTARYLRRFEERAKSHIASRSGRRGEKGAAP